MAITFDPSNRIVQLDSFTTSSSEIWSRWVDWAALSDNAKYGAVMSQLGGVAPVDLYIYMEGGWLVRPLEANGITKITGNVLVADGSSPIAATLGNWQVLVQMETPVKASAIEVNTGSGVTAQDKTDIVNQIYARVIENGESFEQALKLIRAEAAGSITRSGDTHTIKSADGQTDRIIATADENGRVVTSVDVT